MDDVPAEALEALARLFWMLVGWGLCYAFWLRPERRAAREEIERLRPPAGAPPDAPAGE